MKSQSSSQPKIVQMKLLESPAGVGKQNQLKWLPDTHIQQDGDPSAHRVGLIERRIKEDFFFFSYRWQLYANLKVRVDKYTLRDCFYHPF